MELHPGDFLMVSGPSSSGKTTLLLSILKEAEVSDLDKLIVSGKVAYVP